MSKVTRRGILLGSAAAGLVSACANYIPTGGPDDYLAMPEYRLGSGDQLRITVFGEPEMTGSYMVNTLGVVAFPLVGDIPAVGKTLAEFSEALATALREGQILRNPNVGTEVTNYRPFFILGEVRTPGTYPYSARLTVLNAVATAQGFTYRADQGWVYIKHANEDAERRYRLTTTTPVQPGDTVRIGERLF